jgi:hypothetical protein
MGIIWAARLRGSELVLPDAVGTSDPGPFSKSHFATTREQSAAGDVRSESRSIRVRSTNSRSHFATAAYNPDL